MTQPPDLYRVLGVKRSASSDAIRAAFRELVKRHHPDLFSKPAQKEEATERLRQINEAYAVLGNPQRRREYDKSLLQEPVPRQRSREPRRPRRTAREKPKAAQRRRRAKIRFPWAFFSKKKLGYAFGAAAAALLAFFAVRTEARWITAWALVEKLEVSAGESGAPPQRQSDDWLPLAQYGSAPECSGALKAQVQEDERLGAKAVFDERSGMMAITVRIGTAAGEAANPDSGAARADPTAPSGAKPAQPVVKRVRNLECRVTRRMERSSWIQRALRRAGLFS